MYMCREYCLLFSCCFCSLLIWKVVPLSPRFFFKKKSEGDIEIASVRPSVCPLCYLLLNHWSKFNQIWCVSYSHERGNVKLFLPRPLGPKEWSTVKYHLISIIKSNWKIFIPNFVSVLTNERYKTYKTGFLFCRLGHAPGVGLGDAGSVKNFSVGICDGALSTARSSCFCFFLILIVFCRFCFSFLLFLLLFFFFIT